MVIFFSLGIGTYLIIIFGPCLSFLRHNRCQIKTVMIEHSIEWINSVEHFCGPFLLEGGRGGASQSYWLSNNPNYWICWQRFWKIQLSIWSLGVLSIYTNHPTDNFVYENSNIQITSIIVKHRPAANWTKSVQDAKKSKRHSLPLQDNSLMLSEAFQK